MPRSHYLLVPISGQGVLIDPGMREILQAAMIPPFAYTDIYLYSHGWWTRAEQAMIDYNRFIMGFAPIGIAQGTDSRPSLGLGVHWPSVVSEDSNVVTTVLQPFTYFNRSKMADQVGAHGGYSLLRLMLEARRDAKVEPPRFHVIGHSFGCKVVCSALEELAETFAGTGLLDNVRFDAVLLQGAFDNDAMEPGKAYGQILPTLPNLRVLVTRSDLDTAVGTEYEAVQRLMNLFLKTPTPGLGAAGPSAATVTAAGGSTALQVGPGYMPPAPNALNSRMIVADLTPLHAANPANNDMFAGHHSDVFYDEIYRLMTAFFA
jgi:pimeloyl-ACP methyl ester carboxylesterase